ncbi:N-6 DNA methylase [Sphingomonas aurantiaca]|uniref:site-specific DNA-methyltransferase (adenine-specific) n=1 Tax=Sphingomonas aurantiaca TaxID=185949 RepID=A0A2T5GPF2_9SPHN|nr:N-6 DNA methylase [Sphingomonas aurantiaca]PTQ61210.1 N-6 DNA methylase [Sphingomonas aurantiaca]
MVNDKKTGSFFTPDPLAVSIVNHLALTLNASKQSSLAVLEPSVGNGAFVTALSKTKTIQNRVSILHGVDIEPAFVDACEDIALTVPEVRFFREDFIDFQGRESGYDIIIGNPPYVSYKHLSAEKVNGARAIFNENGLAKGDFRNLWTLFLLKSASLLKDDGIMAFVLPKEVVYVNHAGWLRSRLLRDFTRVEVFVFDELHFEHAVQDVAVIFCYRNHDSAGFYVGEGKGGSINPSDLRLIEIDKFYGSKWSQFKISDLDNGLLSRCTTGFFPVQKYCIAVAGIVPAANDFFVIDASKVEELEAKSFVRKIVSKSNYLGKDLVLNDQVMNRIVDAGLPAFLLTGYDFDEPPTGISEYLKAGEDLALDQRYKMVRRNPWHRIPGIWSSDAVFFKRIGELPKFVLNDVAALVTDTAYRVTALEGVDLRSLIFSFYNSATMVAAELQGRTYGGGVLELTPNEFKRLPVPFSRVSETEFQEFVAHIKTHSFSDALARQDDYLLPRAGVSNADIAAIQQVRHELYVKRLKKGKIKP